MAMKIEMRSSGTVKTLDREESVYSDARTSLHPPQKTIRLPLWIPAVTVAFFLLIVIALGVSVWSLNRSLKAQQTQAGADGSTSLSAEQNAIVGELSSPYLDITDIKQQALALAGLEAEEVTFITTKLNSKTNPVQYEIIFLKHDGTQYEYHLNAESGALLHYQVTQTDTAVDSTDFILMAEARQIALDCAGLEEAIFTKERLDLDNTVYCYKLDFYDAARRTYTVHLQAAGGAVLRYEVEEPQDTGLQLISLAEAKQQALARAGVRDQEQVTFTKEKRDGAVYLLAFTLEDGTQYTIELNGETGMANTVDVVPVSADTSQFLGFTEAKRLALEKAGLSPDEAVIYTKAKIDRDSAAYVYELDFETESYEYEVSIHTITGEVIKYEAWFR